MTHFNPENLAVLLIDMQSGFINTEEKRKLIPNQISVLNQCFKKEIPVIIVEFEGEGKTDDALLKVVENNHTSACHKITKSVNDAFSEKELNNLLKKIKAKTLLLMGINACACVFETAVTAKRKGYELITSEDLIAGYCEGWGCNKE